jgi:hypothetical protein
VVLFTIVNATVTVRCLNYPEVISFYDLVLHVVSHSTVAYYIGFKTQSQELFFKKSATI